MPHFGLMDTRDSFEKEEGALLRARLHIRSGKRRLRQERYRQALLPFTMLSSSLAMVHFFA